MVQILGRTDDEGVFKSQHNIVVRQKGTLETEYSRRGQHLQSTPPGSIKMHSFSFEIMLQQNYFPKIKFFQKVIPKRFDSSFKRKGERHGLTKERLLPGTVPPKNGPSKDQLVQRTVKVIIIYTLQLMTNSVIQLELKPYLTSNG